VLNLGYGAQFGERLHVLIGGDFAKDEGTGNFYARDVFRSEPGVVGRISETSPAQSFADGVESIYTAGGIISGGPLNGTAFTLGGAPYAFSYGAVVGNNQIGATSNYGLSPLLVVQLRHPSKRRNLMLAADLDLSDRVQLFTEINSAFNTSAGGYGDTLQTTYTINSTNPFIPASVRSQLAARGLTSFNLGRFNTDISSYRSAQRYRTGRAMLGLRGVAELLGGAWKWEAYGQLGRTRADTRYERMIDTPNLLAAINVVSDASGVATCAPAATNPNTTVAQQAQAEPGCVPFNVFGQTNTVAAIDYVTGTVEGLTKIDQDIAAVSFSGAPFHLPAGDVSLAFGGEFRHETIVASSDPRSKLGAWQVLSQASFSKANAVKEIYVETGVPILRQARVAKSLDLNAAIRRTDYRISGAVTTWKLGASWEPTDFLRFRATQSRDIRAPNLTELSLQGLIIGQGNFFNPFLQQIELRTAIQVTGNANLVPEIADSFTAGVAFQPQWRPVRGLRVSVDYYRIQVRKVIGALSFTDTVQRCFNGDQSLCAQITFDSAQRITLVKTPQINFAGLDTEGLDIEVSYRLPAGALPFDLPGALNMRNLTTVVSRNARSDDVITVNRNGFSNGGTAKLTGSATADYTLGRFTGGLQARYFGDVRWDPALVGPDSPFYAPKLSNSISRNLFPGQVIFGANAAFSLLNDSGRSVQIFAVVNNLFDRAPSKQGAIAFNQNGVQYYDLIGRLYRVGARLRF
jgi:outer membrane receptor protein involved in Fe transport